MFTLMSANFAEDHERNIHSNASIIREVPWVRGYSIQCLSKGVHLFRKNSAKIMVKLGDNCIVFNNFAALIGDLMVAN